LGTVVGCSGEDGDTQVEDSLGDSLGTVWGQFGDSSGMLLGEDGDTQVEDNLGDSLGTSWGQLRYTPSHHMSLRGEATVHGVTPRGDTTG